MLLLMHLASEELLSRRTSRTILVLPLVITALADVRTPLYNNASPYLGGLPFFYWPQVLLLLPCAIPYSAFSYMENSGAERS